MAGAEEVAASVRSVASECVRSVLFQGGREGGHKLIFFFPGPQSHESEKGERERERDDLLFMYLGRDEEKMGREAAYIFATSAPCVSGR
jgi:hypothetical protein